MCHSPGQKGIWHALAPACSVAATNAFALASLIPHFHTIMFSFSTRFPFSTPRRKYVQKQVLRQNYSSDSVI